MICKKCGGRLNRGNICPTCGFDNCYSTDQLPESLLIIDRLERADAPEEVDFSGWTDIHKEVQLENREHPVLPVDEKPELAADKKTDETSWSAGVQDERRKNEPVHITPKKGGVYIEKRKSVQNSPLRSDRRQNDQNGQDVTDDRRHGTRQGDASESEKHVRQDGTRQKRTQNKHRFPVIPVILGLCVSVLLCLLAVKLLSKPVSGDDRSLQAAAVAVETETEAEGKGTVILNRISESDKMKKETDEGAAVVKIQESRSHETENDMSKDASSGTTAGGTASYGYGFAMTESESETEMTGYGTEPSVYRGYR